MTHTFYILCCFSFSTSLSCLWRTRLFLDFPSARDILAGSEGKRAIETFVSGVLTGKCPPREMFSSFFLLLHLTRDLGSDFLGCALCCEWGLLGMHRALTRWREEEGGTSKTRHVLGHEEQVGVSGSLITFLLLQQTCTSQAMPQKMSRNGKGGEHRPTFLHAGAKK